MAARKNKVQLGEKWRERIQISMLVNRLTDHALGKVEMSATQVRAVEILLKKVAPDLSAVDISGEITRTVRDVGDDELTNIATSGSSGAVETPSGPKEPSSVH